MKKLTLTICMPVYKGSAVLHEVLSSILKQSFTDFDLLITDDNQPEWKEEIAKTKKIIDSFKDKRITYIKNRKNLGTQQNIRKLFTLAKGDIVFYMADDLLAENALQKTYDAFYLDDNIGGVTRPYFWFEKDFKKPVRVVRPPDNTKDVILSVHDGEEAITAIFGSVGQISGLAYRKSWIDVHFNDDIFPGHIYPFAGMLKKHKCVFLKDYTVAVGIRGSQTRSISSIYETSPTTQWINMFKTVYAGKEYEKIRNACIKHIASHFEGLVQLKNYARKGVLEEEIKILLRAYPKNATSPKFWFYVVLTKLMPKKLLILLTDNYKKFILSRSLDDISFRLPQ